MAPKSRASKRTAAPSAKVREATGNEKVPSPPPPDPEEEKNDATDEATRADAEHEQTDVRPQDLIDAEQQNAEKRGTAMSGECEEFKGKSLDERIAMQPEPTFYKTQLSGDDEGKRVEAGKLSFVGCKGEVMLYDKKSHERGAGMTPLTTYSAFGRRPAVYNHPTELEVFQSFGGIKKAHNKYIFLSILEDVPMKMALFSIAESRVCEYPMCTRGISSYEASTRDIGMAIRAAREWFDAKINPQSRVARAAEEKARAAEEEKARAAEETARAAEKASADAAAADAARARQEKAQGMAQGTLGVKAGNANVPLTSRAAAAATRDAQALHLRSCARRTRRFPRYAAQACLTCARLFKRWGSPPTATRVLL